MARHKHVAQMVKLEKTIEIFIRKKEIHEVKVKVELWPLIFAGLGGRPVAGNGRKLQKLDETVREWSKKKSDRRSGHNL